MTVSVTDLRVTIDPVSGRPTEEIGGVRAAYQLIEIATGNNCGQRSTFADVGYDVPAAGQKRSQRGQIDAQGRAVNVVADAIGKRLASYFVEGT